MALKSECDNKIPWGVDNARDGRRRAQCYARRKCALVVQGFACDFNYVNRQLSSNLEFYD